MQQLSSLAGPWVWYMLATAGRYFSSQGRRTSRRRRRISEGKSQYNTSPNGTPFDLYDHRKDLSNQGPPDGESFRGRGFVQLTGRANYTRYAHETGHDLVANPALANDSAIAAELLARFLARSEERR